MSVQHRLILPRHASPRERIMAWQATPYSPLSLVCLRSCWEVPRQCKDSKQCYISTQTHWLQCYISREQSNHMLRHNIWVVQVKIWDICHGRPNPLPPDESPRLSKGWRYYQRQSSNLPLYYNTRPLWKLRHQENGPPPVTARRPLSVASTSNNS